MRMRMRMGMENVCSLKSIEEKLHGARLKKCTSFGSKKGPREPKAVQPKEPSCPTSGAAAEHLPGGCLGLKHCSRHPLV